MFALVNTFNALPRTRGTVISVHPTLEAAEAAAARLQEAVRRANGRSSYLPTTIVEMSAPVQRGEVVS